MKLIDLAVLQCADRMHLDPWKIAGTWTYLQLWMTFEYLRDADAASEAIMNEAREGGGGSGAGAPEMQVKKGARTCAIGEWFNLAMDGSPGVAREAYPKGKRVVN